MDFHVTCDEVVEVNVPNVLATFLAVEGMGFQRGEEVNQEVE